METHKHHEVLTIPNLMSAARILCIPLFCWLYLTAETPEALHLAVLVVVLSSVTDMLDGVIARKFNQITRLGKILDPVADKLTHAALAVCLALRHPLLWGLLALMVVKDGYMAVMGLRFMRRGVMLNGAMWYGKVCTAALFIGLLVLLAFSLPAAAANALIAGLMVLMTVTLVLYIRQYGRMSRGELGEEVDRL